MIPLLVPTVLTWSYLAMTIASVSIARGPYMHTAQGAQGIWEDLQSLNSLSFLQEGGPQLRVP